MNIHIWNEFYESINTDTSHRGALPFRIWQIYNEMIRFLKAGDIEKFVCAAGIVSHYVGDASQPLHTSKYHHGHPGNQSESRVHSVYETNMIDKFAVEIVTGVNEKLSGMKSEPSISDSNKGGKTIAGSVVDLMKKSMQILPPLDIVDAFNESSGQIRLEHMFQVLGNRTIDVISEGCITLATIWENAWKEGNGDQISEDKITLIGSENLQQLYSTITFLESFRLN
ncbi:MAG TPA: hypothetical protein VN704_13630, partial [Verrucomicrobiae bacterium]|nr:hypothetical protein [Verrucomicrobiae bacterium]